MPALSNAKRELFAQGIASGKDPQVAYVDAGFKKSGCNPYVLKKRNEVQSRVIELLEERHKASLQKTISEEHYTREVLLAELEEARELALDKNQPSAAVSATIGKARVLGLIIDRREVGDVGAFDGMTDEELVAEAARKARELGIAGPQDVVTATDVDFLRERLGAGDDGDEDEAA